MLEQENYLHRDLETKQERLAGVFRDQFRNFSNSIEKVLKALPVMQKQLQEINKENDQIAKGISDQRDRFTKEMKELTKAIQSVQRENSAIKQSLATIQRDIQNIKNKR